ncbi:DUF4230 domain-containing protein [Cesiribacter andamanensis]|uniref:DUF4230 domain-containing protein n=1 Tax=Cesiribacter andamanensis AMV16 TaxID=1279009 RepID=M7NBS2_9BACT|nr:DUF4230 domain-containing protein [Cesiribacter andamanensis]EMR04697.1 hypothetical protein ADICEAN_00149 [Cesiribacter andamanensis AMV16]
MLLIRFVRFLLRWSPLLIFIVAAIWLLRNPFNWFGKSEEPVTIINHDVVLQEIESLGRLELVRYRYKDIVELTEKNARYLGIFEVPDSKVALITTGEAVGCMDLTKITAEDILIRGDTILVHLPAAELCYYKLDLANSRVYSVDKQVYFKSESQLLEKAYRQAEQQMRRSALQGGILNETRQNAEQVLRPLLEKVSGKRILFLDQQPPPQKLERRQ